MIKSFVAITSATIMFSLLPQSAFAQAPSSPFVGGLGGVTFGTVSSGAFAARAGVPLAPGVSVIFEVGRMQDVLPQELADDLDLVEELIELETGPITLNVSVPSTYGFGGVRYAKAGRVSPFVEAGAGVGRISLSVDEAEVFGVDISGLIEDELGDDTNATKFLLALGGGVNVPVGGSASLDVGYRYTRIFTEEPVINSSMVYAAMTFGFSR